MKRKIWILTLFPDYFEPLKNFGVISSQFQEKGNYCLKTIDIAKYAKNNFKGVDDSPYGGGPGMVMRADVLKNALMAVVKNGNYGTNYREKLLVLACDPRGEIFCQNMAKEFSLEEKDLVFICGRYEGIDQRFLDIYVDRLISLGSFVMSGGEIAAMAMIDSFLRLVSGTLGNQKSLNSESFNCNQYDHPHYTRPFSFENKEVPKVLLSGNHQEIEAWREKERKDI